MFKILGVILAITLSTVSGSVASTACQYIVGEEALYNLFSFANVNATVDAGLNQSIIFSLCDSKISSCDSTGAAVTAKLITNITKDCENLAGTIPAVPTLMESNDPDTGLILTYPVSDDNYTLIVNLTCDDTIPVGEIKWSTTEDVVNSVYTISGSGAPGCPVITLARYLAFFEKYRALFAVAFLIIGGFALFFGLQFFNVTIFVFTAVAAATVLFVILFGFAAIKTSIGVEWVLFVICCIVGVGCGYGAIKVERVGFFILGAFFGGIGALFLYSFLLHFIGMSQVVLYVIIGLCAAIGGGLAVWLWKDIIILATSCIGGYMIVRGLSFFIGGFPNEIAVAEGLQKYDYVAYAYLVVIILVSIGGMVFQFKKKKQRELNEQEIGDDTVTKERLLA